MPHPDAARGNVSRQDHTPCGISGDPQPSEADINVTRDLVRVGQIMKIEFLDHIVMALASAERPKDWCSLRELGYLV